MIDFKTIKKVLTFFAHPDDETLAAGATISRLAGEGIEVVVAIPATGIHSRKNVQDQKYRDEQLIDLRQDCQQALEKIGIKPDNIFFGGFPDNEMDKHTLLELIHWLEEIIAKVKPDVIFTHHKNCTNIDHQYCHDAVIVATRPSLNENITMICGEVPSSTGYMKPTQWEPNYYVNISEEDLNNKIKAMQSFTGEARPDPHPRSPEVLKALAKVRGSESGFYYAESFMINKIFSPRSK